MGGSAWNTLLAGTKLWTLVSPCDALSGVWDMPPQASVDMCGREQLELLLTTRYEHDPSTLAKYQSELLGGSEKVLQFEQRPGETLFIPRGWAHAVRNLGSTIAITGNYAPGYDLEHVLDVMESYGGKPYRAYWEHRLTVNTSYTSMLDREPTTNSR